MGRIVVSPRMSGCGWEGVFFPLLLWRRSLVGGTSGVATVAGRTGRVRLCGVGFSACADGGLAPSWPLGLVGIVVVRWLRGRGAADGSADEIGALGVDHFHDLIELARWGASRRWWDEVFGVGWTGVILLR